MTLCLSLFSFVLTEEFERSEVGEGLVRPHAVVDIFPVAELAVEHGKLVGVRVHFIKLLVVGAVGTLDMAIQFG